MPPVRYELLSICPHTGARRGRLHTPHGTVETPCFMPVGTQGTVKTVGSEDLESLGFELILSNTYHLSLRPGSELIGRFGGLHRFMSWKGAILTDSGGYQVMSLSNSRKLTDEGVTFKSHLDGSEHFISPERSIEIQAQLGVDISMALDVCPPYPCTRDEAAEAMRRTHLWAPRNLAARHSTPQPPSSFSRDGSGTNRGVPRHEENEEGGPEILGHQENEEGGEQAIFGIVQGGIHEDLRRESAATITAMPFDGFAIGGVSVGEPTELQYPVVRLTAPLLPADKPRYLMGVGHPRDILHAVSCGIDMFDCVLPTRMARHHALYTLQGRVNILNKKWEEFAGPVDEESVFPQTERYSAAYLRHLMRAGEPLGARLCTLHNLAFYARLMREIREAIERGTWPALIERYARA
ncbi:MAG TPA: tRNA guanosine(34) transglycosylase Tgt [Fimbriimonadaceae bacterium]|nr:tRNA guanosine(34) transglycosylase Tgt [Fimbriimonadaceae bacterium]